LCNAHRQEDVPKHLFGVPELDLSADLSAERLAGPWFSLGPWTFGSGSDGQGVENVVYRQSMLLSPGDFGGIFDKLESIVSASANRAARSSVRAIKWCIALRYAFDLG
jgi:hypothetical protein